MWAQDVNLPPLSSIGIGDGAGALYYMAYEPFVLPWEQLVEASESCSFTMPQQFRQYDQDRDGLWDFAEAELAWVFAPYLSFDENEPELQNGVVMLYEAYPVNGDLIAITYVFLFQKGDGARLTDDQRIDKHDGDSEAITVYLKRVGTSAWGLYLVTRFHKGMDMDWSLNPFEFGACLIPGSTLCLGILLSKAIEGIAAGREPLFCFNPYLEESEYTDPLFQYLSSDVVDEAMDRLRSRPCEMVYFEDVVAFEGYPSSWPDDVPVRHLKVYVSNGKHGLYPSKSVCEKTIHGGWREYCGTGHLFPVIQGYKSVYDPNFQQPDGHGTGRVEMDLAGTWRMLINQAREGDATALREFMYKGNLGEKGIEDGPYVRDLSEWFGGGEEVEHGCFCGGRWDELCADGKECACSGLDTDCAKGVSEKLNPSVILFSYDCGIRDDRDGDGVQDGLDCEPDNPYLGMDLDRDGVCDDGAILPPGIHQGSDPSTACTNVCGWLYMGNDRARSLCSFRCQTKDTCVPPEDSECREIFLRDAQGEVVDHSAVEACKSIYVEDNTIEPVSLWMCRPEVGTCSPSTILVQGPGRCSLAPWARLFTSYHYEEFYATRFSKCTVPVLDIEMWYKAGGYVYDSGEAVRVDSGGEELVEGGENHLVSIMACMTGECDWSVDPPIDGTEETGWHPIAMDYITPTSQGMEVVEGMTSGGGTVVRHLGLEFTPEVEKVHLAGTAEGVTAALGLVCVDARQIALMGDWLPLRLSIEDPYGFEPNTGRTDLVAGEDWWEGGVLAPEFLVSEMVCHGDSASEEEANAFLELPPLWLVPDSVWGPVGGMMVWASEQMGQEGAAGAVALVDDSQRVVAVGPVYGPISITETMPWQMVLVRLPSLASGTKSSFGCEGGYSVYLWTPGLGDGMFLTRCADRWVEVPWDEVFDLSLGLSDATDSMGVRIAGNGGELVVMRERGGGVEVSRVSLRAGSYDGAAYVSGLEGRLGEYAFAYDGYGARLYMLKTGEATRLDVLEFGTPGVEKVPLTKEIRVNGETGSMVASVDGIYVVEEDGSVKRVGVDGGVEEKVPPGEVDGLLGGSGAEGVVVVSHDGTSVEMLDVMSETRRTLSLVARDEDPRLAGTEEKAATTCPTCPECEEREECDSEPCSGGCGCKVVGRKMGEEVGFMRVVLVVMMVLVFRKKMGKGA